MQGFSKWGVPLGVPRLPRPVEQPPTEAVETIGGSADVAWVPATPEQDTSYPLVPAVPEPSIPEVESLTDEPEVEYNDPVPDDAPQTEVPDDDDETEAAPPRRGEGGPDGA